MKNGFFQKLGVALLALLGSAVVLRAQPMPVEARDSIHQLFNQHDQIKRELQLTETGYTATTISTNQAVVRALKKHVSHMSDRLEAGLMVRRWDPAFAEYVEYYGQLEHKFEPIENGIRATVKGKTPEAVKVAQNHAKVIADFASHGWDAHDRSHPAALDVPKSVEPVAKQAKPACCMDAGSKEGPSAGQVCGEGCCRKADAR